MSKTKGTKTTPKQLTTPAAPTKLVERNLAAINPLKEQFEPTDSRPLPQRYTMGGGA